MVVMEPDGSLFYHNMKDISPELHRCLQTHLREIPATGSLKFYYTERSQLYSITAQVLLMNNVQRYLFYCVPSRIPLHSSRPGLRSLNQGECEYLFSNSFYSLSGAMGTPGRRDQRPCRRASAPVHLRRAGHRQRADRPLPLPAQRTGKPPPRGGELRFDERQIMGFSAQPL